MNGKKVYRIAKILAIVITVVLIIMTAYSALVNYLIAEEAKKPITPIVTCRYYTYSEIIKGVMEYTGYWPRWKYTEEGNEANLSLTFRDGTQEKFKLRQYDYTDDRYYEAFVPINFSWYSRYAYPFYHGEMDWGYGRGIQYITIEEANELYKQCEGYDGKEITLVDNSYLALGEVMISLQMNDEVYTYPKDDWYTRNNSISTRCLSQLLFVYQSRDVN